MVYEIWYTITWFLFFLYFGGVLWTFPTATDLCFWLMDRFISTIVGTFFNIDDDVKKDGQINDESSIFCTYRSCYVKKSMIGWEGLFPDSQFVYRALICIVFGMVLYTPAIFHSPWWLIIIVIFFPCGLWILWIIFSQTDIIWKSNLYLK